ncbi:hypothetical protein CEXT_487241 [Caerostris extrusa]|uniref:Uncharacterized protein n=1 Tax=Caerostris extrusa TaxID=172846 RepID=A0AAV4MHB7_CAEEX|nr:hypothetical protein CEXT_487241 [Caerostris extrusa]
MTSSRHCNRVMAVTSLRLSGRLSLRAQTSAPGMSQDVFSWDIFSLTESKVALKRKGRHPPFRSHGSIKATLFVWEETLSQQPLSPEGRTLSGSRFVLIKRYNSVKTRGLFVPPDCGSRSPPQEWHSISSAGVKSAISMPDRFLCCLDTLSLVEDSNSRNDDYELKSENK